MMFRAFHHRPGKALTLPALLSLILLSMPFLSVASGLALAQSAQPVTVDNPYGVNIFLHKEVEPWKLEQTLRMVAEANIPWVKQEFPWQEIEFKKGYFYDDKWQKSAWEKFDRIVDLADKYHLKIVARVDHPPGWAKSDGSGNSPLRDNKDLADFINALLDHYDGRIKYVQVWNEPNLNAEWVRGKPVDPAAYVDMLKTVYPAVKAAHPDAVLLSAPMAMTLEGIGSRGNMNEIDYWTKMYEAGVKGNFDIASANGYGLDQPPDAPPDPGVLNFRRVELLHDIMVRNGDDRQIWFDEYGWNASPESLPEVEKNYWRHVTPERQAEWSVAGIEYARKNWPWAGVISIWYFRQVGDIPPEKAEYYFAMVNPDFSAQPVYNAIKTSASQYPGPASQPAGTPIYPPPTPTTPLATRPTANVATPTRPAARTPTATLAAATPTTVLTATVLAPAQESPTVGPTESVAPTTPPTVPASATPARQISPTPGASGTATPRPPAVESANDGNPLLFIIGGLLVLAGLGGLGYYLLKGRAAAKTTDTDDVIRKS